MASSLGAALTIVAILIFIFVTLPDSGVTTSPVDKEDDYYLRGSINETSEGKKVTSNTKEYVCGASTEKRNQFIKEYTIPISCTQPIGIAVDNTNKIWIGATWIGYLIVFAQFLFP